MKDILLNEIENLIKKQPKCESLDGYDDHGMYYDAGYYDGYVDALTTVLKLIEKEWRRTKHGKAIYDRCSEI